MEPGSGDAVNGNSFNSLAVMAIDRSKTSG
jgi:hypothetical protein